MTSQDFSVMLDVSSDSLAMRAKYFHVLQNHWGFLRWKIFFSFCEILRSFPRLALQRASSMSNQINQNPRRKKRANHQIKSGLSHIYLYLFWTFLVVAGKFLRIPMNFRIKEGEVSFTFIWYYLALKVANFTEILSPGFARELCFGHQLLNLRNYSFETESSRNCILEYTHQIGLKQASCSISNWRYKRNLWLP